LENTHYRYHLCSVFSHELVPFFSVAVCFSLCAVACCFVCVNDFFLCFVISCKCQMFLSREFIETTRRMLLFIIDFIYFFY
jgi:hypothetical protein